MTELTPDDRVGQIEVIPFRQGEEPGSWETLVLKRNEQKGGFWQPVTGGIEPGETVEQTAYRELEEELAVTGDDCLTFINDGYRFTFTDMHRGTLRTFTEHVVAVVLPREFDVALSHEHVEARWTSRLGALALLKYESNKAALEHYWEIATGAIRNE